jgi:hypothetical protein
MLFHENMNTDSDLMPLLFDGGSNNSFDGHDFKQSMMGIAAGIGVEHSNLLQATSIWGHNDVVDPAIFTSLPDLSMFGEGCIEEECAEDDTKRTLTNDVNVDIFQLTEQELGDMQFKQFSELIATSGLSATQIESFRTVRRRVKNRRCAKKCSKRKRTRYSKVNEANSKMQEDMDQLAAKNDALRRENERIVRERDVLAKSNHFLMTQMNFYRANAVRRRGFDDEHEKFDSFERPAMAA